VGTARHLFIVHIVPITHVNAKSIVQSLAWTACSARNAFNPIGVFKMKKSVLLASAAMFVIGATSLSTASVARDRIDHDGPRHEAKDKVDHDRKDNKGHDKVDHDAPGHK
jgi:hypothetical protein